MNIIITQIIRSNLPWDPSKYEQQSVVDVEPVVLWIDVSDPVDLHGGEWLDVRVGPRERDAHPQPDEDAEQLDDVGVGHGVQAAEQSVEHRHAGAEDHRRALLHVDDHGQGGAYAHKPRELYLCGRQFLPADAEHKRQCNSG